MTVFAVGRRVRAGEDGETEFALKEEGVEVVGEAGVRMATGEGVESNAGGGREEGREGSLEVGGCFEGGGGEGVLLE